MAEIKYVNSANRSMDLSTYPIRMKQKTSGLYAFEWEVDETDLGNGARVNAFERKSRQYELEIDFTNCPVPVVIDLRFGCNDIGFDILLVDI